MFSSEFASATTYSSASVQASTVPRAGHSVTGELLSADATRQLAAASTCSPPQDSCGTSRQRRQRTRPHPGFTLWIDRTLVAQPPPQFGTSRVFAYTFGVVLGIDIGFLGEQGTALLKSFAEGDDE